jgi:sulfate adenylyltransferase
MTDLDTLRAWPVWHPPRDVLEAAELVVIGALPELPEAPPVPAEILDRVGAEPGVDGVLLEDAEGTPVATLRPAAGGGWQVGPVRPFSHGPVRDARRLPGEVREELAGLTGDGPVLAVPVPGALTVQEVSHAVTRARKDGGRLLWLALVGDGRRQDLPARALWRAVAATASDVPLPGVAVPVGVPALADPDADASVIKAVATAYGASEVLPPPPRDAAFETTLHRASLRELTRSVAPPQRRGVTVFFTGLSGSGKSTVAKALAAELEERTLRTVSLLDGDEVRRLLSAGLGFSRADRDLNIRRIGFVAAEVSRHGGIAICAPIAPFTQTRQEVRAMVEEVGDFVLVHVATPLAECERRDRKGLYAKARQGLVPEFTGISSPYETPDDAELRIDTSQVDVPDAVAAVWSLLESRGYLGATS